eukprot:557484-Rhodomonas_salina.2
MRAEGARGRRCEVWASARTLNKDKNENENENENENQNKNISSSSSSNSNAITNPPRRMIRIKGLGQCALEKRWTQRVFGAETHL